MDGRHCNTSRSPGWKDETGRCGHYFVDEKQYCPLLDQGGDAWERSNAERYEWQPPMYWGPHSNPIAQKRLSNPRIMNASKTCVLRRDDAVQVFKNKTTCFWGDSISQGHAMTLQQEMVAKDGESGESRTGMRPEYGDAKVLLTKNSYLVQKVSGTVDNCPRGSAIIQQPYALAQADELKEFSECDILVINTGVHWHCV